VKNLTQKRERTYSDISTEQDFGDPEGNDEHPSSVYLLYG
jgi:hypothetical protein